MQEKMYTVEEVAELMRVGKETVRIWVRTKKLPATRFGQKWLIHQFDIPTYARQDKYFGDQLKVKKNLPKWKFSWSF